MSIVVIWCWVVYFFVFCFLCFVVFFFFFFQAEDGIRDHCVTGVQTCALPILVRTVGRNWWAVAAAMLAVASACTEPQSPEQRPQLLLTDGATLAVDVNTTFAFPDVSSTGSIDPDGYTVWVDGSTSQAVATNGVVTFSGLAGGDHEVALYGIAPNCTVDDVLLSTGSTPQTNPRGVSLISGLGGSANFSLACGSWEIGRAHV